MQRLPMLLGAVALALTTGAVAGTTISTDPIGNRQDISDLLPQRQAVVAQRSLERAVPLPNHYALETPEGRIEVSELIWHGRYRDRVHPASTMDLPTDEELFRTEELPYRYAQVNPNTSREASILDAQQPRIERDPAIARLDEDRTSYGQSMARVVSFAGAPPAPATETPTLPTAAAAVITVSTGSQPARQVTVDPAGAM